MNALCHKAIGSSDILLYSDFWMASYIVSRRAMLCISTAYAIMWCPSIRLSHVVSFHLSVTFVYSVETNKFMFKDFSPSGKNTVLVFSHQTLWQYSDGKPQRGVECRWRRQALRFSTTISLHCMLSVLRPPGVINTVPPDRGKLWTHSGVCWWRETTTKCLWQEASTLPGDNRTAFNCMQW